jgi:hypothetical protein
MAEETKSTLIEQARTGNYVLGFTYFFPVNIESFFFTAHRDREHRLANELHLNDTPSAVASSGQAAMDNFIVRLAECPIEIGDPPEDAAARVVLFETRIATATATANEIAVYLHLLLFGPFTDRGLVVHHFAVSGSEFNGVVDVAILNRERKMVGVIMVKSGDASVVAARRQAHCHAINALTFNATQPLICVGFAHGTASLDLCVKLEGQPKLGVYAFASDQLWQDLVTLCSLLCV